MLAAHWEAFLSQEIPEYPGTSNWEFHRQTIRATHESLNTLKERFEPVIAAAATQHQDLRLFGHRKPMSAFNHPSSCTQLGHFVACSF